MITEVTVLGGGGSFSVQNDFSDLGIGLIPSSVPIINDVAFTISGLDAWLLEAIHPDGAASGRIIMLNDTPSELSPGGFGGFAKMGCEIVVPVSLTGVAPDEVATPWTVQFTTGVLSATGIYTISYSIGQRPGGPR